MGRGEIVLRKFFDFNKTIKHVPYKVLKARHERNRRRTELLFQILFWGLMIWMLIVLVGGMLPV
jgi:hypothetical protein